MTSSQKQSTFSYYSVTISPIDGRKLLPSNNERAFVLSQLQDLLCARSVLEAPLPHRHLAAHVDLLAYSLQERDIRLITFAINPSALHELCRIIIFRLRQYQSEYSSGRTLPQEPVSMLIRLNGPHHALTASISLHLRHTDWEYDRYSSIGFYLHDRRGDWMHLWRLTRLFNNNPDRYRALIEHALHPLDNAADSLAGAAEKQILKDVKSDSLSHE